MLEQFGRVAAARMRDPNRKVMVEHPLGNTQAIAFPPCQNELLQHPVII
jgi:hypothetical protein